MMNDHRYRERHEPGNSHGWERSVIEKVASQSLSEQRRARRWSVFFKLLTFSYIAVAFLLVRGPGSFDFNISEKEKHTAVVNIHGPIASDTPASASRIIAGINAALEDEQTAAVLLSVNSPGGSPVESGRVYDELMRLKIKYPDTPIYTVVQEICASGCYYIAAAADKIYADKASLVGSIGVRSGGFGFVETIDKLGIERRLFTSGTNKSFLDPFATLKADEVQHMETLLSSIHEQFKDAVRQGRGDSISESEDIFNGLIWTGEQAMDNGLIDAIGSEMTVAREVFDAENLVNFTRGDSLMKQLSDSVGVSFADRLFMWFTVPQTM